MGFDPESPRRQARLMVLLLSPLIVLRVLILVSLSNGSQGIAWIGFAVGVPLLMLWWYVRIRRGWTGMYWNPLSWWVGGRVADAMTQWPTKPGRPPAPVGPLRVPATRTMADPHVHADGSLVRDGSETYYETHPPPLDWHGLVASISARLEEALRRCSTDRAAHRGARDATPRRRTPGGTSVPEDDARDPAVRSTGAWAQLACRVGSMDLDGQHPQRRRRCRRISACGTR